MGLLQGARVMTKITPKEKFNLAIDLLDKTFCRLRPRPSAYTSRITSIQSAVMCAAASGYRHDLGIDL